MVAVFQDRHLVLVAEGDRGLVADAHRHRVEVETLMRQRHSGAPGKLAVAPVAHAAEFVQGDLRHGPIPLL